MTFQSFRTQNDFVLLGKKENTSFLSLFSPSLSILEVYDQCMIRRFVALYLIGSTSSARMSTYRVVTTTDVEKVSESMRSIMKKNEPKQEVIESVYEWNGKVEKDKEIRLTWRDVDESDVDVLTNEIERLHNYKVPMILTIPPVSSDSIYLKGQFRDGSFELAARLVKKRLVGCAQMASDGVVDLKTTTFAKETIEKLLVEHTIHWEPISANPEYLKWLDEVVDISSSKHEEL